jgi:hypothetical protein
MVQRCGATGVSAVDPLCEVFDRPITDERGTLAASQPHARLAPRKSLSQHVVSGVE